MPGSAASLAWRCALAVLAIVAWPTPARAQADTAVAPRASNEPHALAVDWHGTEDCDRGEAVRAKVLRLLGSNQRTLTADVKVTVTVRHEKGSRYVAELETTTAGGGGTKRLEGESCDAIALASSVVIALSLDPNASLDAEPPPDKPEPPRQRQTPKPPVVPPPGPARAGPKRVTFPYLHGSVGVLFALLPNPSAFTSAGVGVRHRRFSLELAGAVYQHRDATRADRPQVGAELRLFSAELLGCFAALPFQLGALEVCPGARLESLGAVAYGVSNPDQGRVLLGAGVGVLRGRLRATSWLSATLDVGIAARPFHPTFVLRGVGDVFEVPVFSPFARTGLAVEF